MRRGGRPGHVRCTAGVGSPWAALHCRSRACQSCGFQVCEPCLFHRRQVLESSLVGEFTGIQVEVTLGYKDKFVKTSVSDVVLRPTLRTAEETLAQLPSCLQACEESGRTHLCLCHSELSSGMCGEMGREDVTVTGPPTLH